MQTKRKIPSKVILISLATLMCVISFGTFYASARLPPSVSPNVSLTMSYDVFGGGSGYSPPKLHYIFNNTVRDVNLTTTPTIYQIDKNSAWTATNVLFGSSSVESWRTVSQTSGTAYVPNLVFNIKFYHQYNVPFSFNVIGGAAGLSPPRVAFTAFGTTTSIPANSYHWADAGTSYSFPSSIQISPSEGWFSIPTNGTITSASKISVTYYHEFLVSADYSVVGEGDQIAPLLTGISLGKHVSMVLSTTLTNLWLDAQSPYSATNLIQSQNPGERWVAGSGASATVNSPLDLTVPYFHQYALSASFSEVGGSNPQQTPVAITIEGLSANKSIVGYLNVVPQAFWFDRGTSYSIVSLLEPSPMERWITFNETSGIMTNPKSVHPVFYHQYLLSTAYSVVGGGGPATPDLSYIYRGSRIIVPLAPSRQNVWADAGTPYTIPLTLAGSTNERWQTSSNEGTVNSPINQTVRYYHQYDFEVSYSFIGGRAPVPPSLDGSFLGASISIALASSPTLTWLDSHTTWSIQEVIFGSSPGERWISSGNKTGDVAPGSSSTLKYQHEYLLFTSPSPLSGGSTSPPSGWYTAGKPIQLEITVNPGWRLAGWIGNGTDAYSGLNSTAPIVLNSPTSETASLNASLILKSSGGGTVSYAVGSKSGTLQAGGSLQFYVRYNTTVTLRANPSLFSSFQGWNGGGAAVVANPLTFKVSSPMELAATFQSGYSVREIAIVSFAVIAIGVGFYLVKWRRSYLSSKLGRAKSLGGRLRR